MCPLIITEPQLMICSILVLRYGSKVPILCKRYVDSVITGIDFKGSVDYKLTWKPLSCIGVNTDGKYAIIETDDIKYDPIVLKNQTGHLVKEGIDRYMLNLPWIIGDRNTKGLKAQISIEIHSIRVEE